MKSQRYEHSNIYGQPRLLNGSRQGEIPEVEEGHVSLKLKAARRLVKKKRRIHGELNR